MDVTILRRNGAELTSWTVHLGTAHDCGSVMNTRRTEEVSGKKEKVTCPQGRAKQL